MDRVLYIIVNSLFRLVSLLPLRAARAIGARIGDLAWWCNSDARKVTEENLRLCFPTMADAQRQQLARASLQHLGMTFMEMGLVWSGEAKKVMGAITRVRGREHVDEAVAAGKGVVVLGPHNGNWEVAGLYLADQFTVTSMFQPPDSPALGRLIHKARERSGAKLVPTNTTGVKALLRALKRGEVVGVLPDQVPPRSSGNFAPFFGVPALTMGLCHSLIGRTGARAVMLFAKRIPRSGEFEIVFLPVPPAIYSEDEQASLTALNQGVEATVNDAPEQYQWEYKRFKKQPDGAPKYYQN